MVLCLSLKFYRNAQVFLSATKRIFTNQIPLLHHIIPLFDIITQKLDQFVDDKKLHPAICTAAAQGHTMMNKYYGLSDNSVMYRVVMHKFIVWFIVICNFLINFLVLHPKHKSSYFIKAGWPSDWIRTAEGLLYSQYQNYYQPNQSDGLERPSVSVQLHYQHLIKTATLIILTNEQASSSHKDYFEELDSYSSTAIGDPIDEWLSTPALTNVNDRLLW